MICVADVDDLISEDQIVEYLVPIKKKVPDFCVTAYTVPNKFGPIEPALRARYPWITFGIHGWEHTPFECMAWSEDSALQHIGDALNMGYNRIFKAPNWRLHDEIVLACARLGVVLHHHESQAPVGLGCHLYPGPKPRSRDYSMLHTHILKNPVTDHISSHFGFLPENLVAYTEFQTPLTFARIA